VSVDQIPQLVIELVETQRQPSTPPPIHETSPSPRDAAASPIPAWRFVSRPARILYGCRRRYTFRSRLYLFQISCYTPCVCSPKEHRGRCGTWIFPSTARQGMCRVRVASTDSGSGLRRPRLVSAGVQITQRAPPVSRLSHTGCRAPKTLTPHPRPRGGIASRILGCHVPSKDILITPTVGAFGFQNYIVCQCYRSSNNLVFKSYPNKYQRR